MRKVLLLSAIATLSPLSAQADVIVPGSTFSVTGTNFADGNGAGAVTVGGAATTIAGDLVQATVLNQSSSKRMDHHLRLQSC